MMLIALAMQLVELPPEGRGDLLDSSLSGYEIRKTRTYCFMEARLAAPAPDGTSFAIVQTPDGDPNLVISNKAWQSLPHEGTQRVSFKLGKNGRMMDVTTMQYQLRLDDGTTGAFQIPVKRADLLAAFLEKSFINISAGGVLLMSGALSGGAAYARTIQCADGLRDPFAK